AAAGIAHFLLSRSARPRVVVGYDTRFLSEKFAEVAAEVLNSHGTETGVATRPDPTPALSHGILPGRLDGGINITASHNPAEYSGLKFSSADGAPALPEVTREIERLVGRVISGDHSLKGARPNGSLRHTADPRPAYLETIRRKVDLKAIAEGRLRIAYDPLYGTARGYLDELLRQSGTAVHVLHDFRDVLFSGVGPEPSEKTLAELAKVIKEDKIVLGGEESAGLSIRGHLPEKDGILACLLVTEAIARRGLTVRQQLEELFKKVGPCYPVRLNFTLEPEVQQRLVEKLKRD